MPDRGREGDGGGRPVVEVTYPLGFGAAHRMHNPRFGAEENRRMYGKCNHPGGHGHTYRLEVTIRGPVDLATGRVADGDLVEGLVRRTLLDRFDHRSLDDLITQADGPTSTTEVVTGLLWRILDAAFPPGRLWRLRVEETANNFFEMNRQDVGDAGAVPPAPATAPGR
ncbi:MAG: 6-carboxytetrahydropterin synthase [candidate division NC10 bacterium]|nr:6-carboxytetrahydropterin synthase [candidate division NC10 bacterium]